MSEHEIGMDDELASVLVGVVSNHEANNSNTKMRNLPDVAGDAAHIVGTLDWVGMQGIDLPLRWSRADGLIERIAARADIGVSLDDAKARGIHMSRLYQLLLDQVQSPVTPDALRQLLEAAVLSQNGSSACASLRLCFDWLIERGALRSPAFGFKRYPCELQITLDAEGKVLAQLQVEVIYSSTCPASAALARQARADAFAEAHAHTEALAREQLCAWLQSQAGQVATAHAQRSLARVNVCLRDGLSTFPIEDLIDTIEAALVTVVQTAVKREDEQAFARLNAANLMFCEDAARRLKQALEQQRWVRTFEVEVAHLESLHAHDAVARVRGRGLAGPY